jgi:hypothetical protein
MVLNLCIQQSLGLIQAEANPCTREPCKVGIERMPSNIDTKQQHNLSTHTDSTPRRNNKPTANAAAAFT